MADLRLHDPGPASPAGASVPIRINGWPYLLSVWTEAKLRALDARPPGLVKVGPDCYVALSPRDG